MVQPEEELSSEDEDEMQSDPLEKAMQFKQCERKDSSDEEDIPLADLQRRKELRMIWMINSVKTSKIRLESGSDGNTESEQSEYSDPNHKILLDTPSVPLDENMEMCEIKSKIGLGFP